jgi:hypothetical protein
MISTVAMMRKVLKAIPPTARFPRTVYHNPMEKSSIQFVVYCRIRVTVFTCTHSYHEVLS